MAKVENKQTARYGYICNRGHFTYIRECQYCCRGVEYDTLVEFLLYKEGKLIKTPISSFIPIHEKLNISCVKGHEFQTTWKNIKFNDRWCCICSKYKTENKVRDIFERLLENPFPCVRPKWLNGLELDGYNEELKLAFEASGIQHFHHVTFFHKTKEEFELLQQRDAEKARICKERKVNLIIVPYTVHEQDLEVYIRQQLSFV